MSRHIATSLPGYATSATERSIARGVSPNKINQAYTAKSNLRTTAVNTILT